MAENNSTRSREGREPAPVGATPVVVHHDFRTTEEKNAARIKEAVARLFASAQPRRPITAELEAQRTAKRKLRQGWTEWTAEKGRRSITNNRAQLAAVAAHEAGVIATALRGFIAETDETGKIFLVAREMLTRVQLLTGVVEDAVTAGADVRDEYLQRVVIGGGGKAPREA